MADKEYIERGAFWRNLEIAPDHWIKGRTIKAILDEQPAADVVEVVRCKDCANCRYVDAADIYRCDRRGYFSEEVKPSDYCSRGERKEQT